MRFTLLSLFLFLLPVCWLQADLGQTERKSSYKIPSAYLPLEEHLERAESCLEQQYWSFAASHFMLVYRHTDSSAMKAQAMFGLAKCEFGLAHYEEADNWLSSYLTEQQRDRRYAEIVQLKFEIAQKFHQGAKRRPFGSPAMPRILSAQEKAVQIFDEVVAALPHSDLAAQALIEKAQVLRKKRQFSASSQALQQAIMDLDNHPIALEAFQEQSRNYLFEMKTTSRNEELLELAKINRQKMLSRFPNADFTQVDARMAAMRELYADSLLDSAVLYHRKKCEKASQLYLHRLIRLYSETKAAQRAKLLLLPEPAAVAPDQGQAPEAPASMTPAPMVLLPVVPVKVPLS